MRRPTNALIAATLASCALLAFATEAHAEPPRPSPFDDPYILPRAPRPPSLPELTHSEIEGTLESTTASLVGAATKSTGFVFAERIGIEAPIGPRRWFVGAEYAFATGSVNGSAEVAGGNLELYGRGVWATSTGLAFGGGLGLVAPTAAFSEASASATLANSAATMRPWEISLFTPHIIGFRPFVDVRNVDGPFVFQFRQGIDILSDATALRNARIFAVVGGYVGYKLSRWVSPGIEAFELYAIDGDTAGIKIREGDRSNIVLSPNCRFSTPVVQPALSAFFSVGPTLYDNANFVFGVRLAVTVVIEAGGGAHLALD